MAHHAPVQADPKQVERAQVLWHNATQATKWSIAAVAVLLIVLALVFIDF